MAFTVVREFIDVKYDSIRYRLGQPYPQDGVAPGVNHINYLLSDANKQQKPFIKFVADEVEKEDPKYVDPGEDESDEKTEFPKHTGGGYYELSNGEKVKGKEEALAAEEALKSGE